MSSPNSRSDSAPGFDSSTPPDPQSGSGASPIFETLAIFGIVAVAQLFTGFLGIMGGLFVLAPPISTNPWTIVTSIYAHGSLGHIVSNSVALVVFGWPIARATTRVRFHTFFVVTGAIAAISQIVVPQFLSSLPFVERILEWLPVVGPELVAVHPVLGASGAVFALLGYLVTGNRISESIASRVSIPDWLTLLFFLGLATAVTITTAAPQVALIAHFTGFLLGLVAGRARVLHPKPSEPGTRRSV